MIPEHPSWQIIDSSKLDDYLTCPRCFFFCHVLGWRLDVPAHDLYFGECWHMAREYQLIHGYSDIEGAYNTFLNQYRKKFPEQTDINFRPKTPEAVKQALTNFAVTYFNDLEDNELLRNPETNEPFTEISGTVPIDNKRVLYFRMDSLLRRKEDGMIFSWDHKSTTKYIFYDNWNRQFFLSVQNGTYTHCMYCLFPVEQVLGVEFCGCGFEYLSRGSAARPAGYYSTLKRVPAFKPPEQMNVWLWNTINTVNNVERDFDRLSDCSENDSIMQSFPQNPGGCGKYRGCEFHDTCMLVANPLRIADEPPFGFREEFWDPREKDARNKMNLEWR
uniref:PD-(D/E)XK nuclease superfamily protein n=1 Tax=viral metagenome TaxID=1070528 RepID=A0A6H1ZSX1_9ZZZZ